MQNTVGVWNRSKATSETSQPQDQVLVEETPDQLRQQIAKLTLELETSQRWNAMSQSITTALLQDTEEEDALMLIASSVRKVAEADTTLIVLPSVGGKYICEIADGEARQDMIGLEFPPDGRAQAVIRNNVGIIVESMERAHLVRVPELAIFGPALYAPMGDFSGATGVIILFRNPGRPEFTKSDLRAAEDFAAQAALALRLSAIRHAEDRAELLEERERIARDLHDLAIQQLFATSLRLDALKSDIKHQVMTEETVRSALDAALRAVSDSVDQIRHIVSDLKDQDTQSQDLLEGLRLEASLSRHALGFAPSLIVRLDNEVFTVENMERLDSTLRQTLSDSLIADVLAVAREGLSNVARHAHATEVRLEVSIWLDPSRIPSECQLTQSNLPASQHPRGLLLMEILDDGCGLDSEMGRRSGLANMATRASIHFGTMRIGERKDRSTGTRVSWCIPILTGE